jgi:DNA topoisomerase-1
MVARDGRFGRFLACSQYPACKTTMPMPGASPEETGPSEIPPCPQCGAPMVMKNGRFGSFLACSRYPECKGKAAVKIGVGCPQEGCDGQIVEKRSRKGKVFYACTRYPECRFALWDRPVPKPCPACATPFLVERIRKSGRTLACWKEGCGFSQPLEE